MKISISILSHKENPIRDTEDHNQTESRRGLLTCCKKQKILTLVKTLWRDDRLKPSLVYIIGSGRVYNQMLLLLIGHDIKIILINH